MQLAGERRRLTKCRYSDTAESDGRHYLALRSVAVLEQIEQVPPVFGPGWPLTALPVHIDLEHAFDLRGRERARNVPTAEAIKEVVELPDYSPEPGCLIGRQVVVGKDANHRLQGGR